jgi:adenosylhomocysteine nucleosidase
LKSLIVLPIQQELDFFLQACAGQGQAAEAGQVGRMPVTCLPGLGITLARGGLGKTQFAVLTQYLIDHAPDWDAVLCVGAAGALDDTLAVGDVVVGTETVEYDIHNKFGKPLVPRFSGNSGLLNQFRNLAQVDDSFRIHFGAIASGDEDVVGVERRKQVRELTNALANAWEGAGGARACQLSDAPFVEIRGISDGANEAAPLDFAANLPGTMRNLATVITRWAGQFRKER